jgi:hypothetical protein
VGAESGWADIPESGGTVLASRACGLANMGKAAIEEAIELTQNANRLHHVGRHLAGEAAPNAVAESVAIAVAREVLSNPMTSIMWRMKTSGQAVTMFVGRTEGRLVGVAVADETLGNVAKNSLVEMIEFKK